jgi:N-acetylmuramoyl-L-alanine amidase
VEVANLNSREDRRLLVRGEFRQRFAEAVVEALIEYYGSQGSAAGAEVARLD